MSFIHPDNFGYIFRKTRTITTCHNLLLFDKKEIEEIKDKKEQSYFLRSARRQSHSFKKSDGTIFLSNYSKLTVCKEVQGIENSTVISHGLDKAFLQTNKRSYKFGSQIKLLYVSPYFHYKHQIEVIKAVQILREETGFNFHLTLIGGGTSSYAVELKTYVAKEEIEHFISVKDKVDYDDLLCEYQSTDIFVFASSCETFGITLLEAMGARLPIACSNQTGLSEILKDAGVYFNPEQPESIVFAIKEITSNLELRETLGEKAYKYASSYTWEQCALETIEYIKEIEKSIERNPKNILYLSRVKEKQVNY